MPLNSESSAASTFALANFLLQQTQIGSAYRLPTGTPFKNFRTSGALYKNLGLAYIQQQNYAKQLRQPDQGGSNPRADGGLLGLIGYSTLNLDRSGPALDAYRPGPWLRAEKPRLAARDS